MKNVRRASVNLGPACKRPSYSARWVAVDTMQFDVIQTGLFSETIRIFGIERVLLNNFAPMSNRLSFGAR